MVAMVTISFLFERRMLTKQQEETLAWMDLYSCTNQYVYANKLSKAALWGDKDCTSALCRPNALSPNVQTFK